MDTDLRKRMQIGCVGALTPILINVLVVDLQTTLSNVSVISVLAYLVRVLGLCAAACIVVYLNSDEARPNKLFQLGIMAPALLTGMINGLAAANNQTPSSSAAPHGAMMPSFVGSAYAQGAPLPSGVTDCSQARTLTVTQQVLKGLAGIVPANEWFVVVGSNPTAQSALDDVATMKARYSGRFQLSVCAPLGGADKRWRVVIGEHMTYPEATKLRDEAAAAGVPEPWLWNPVQPSK
jgi:hypothetical protein